MTDAQPATQPTAQPTTLPTTQPQWVLTGPTAVGKTELSLRIAEARGLEILSMDSMAIFRQMDIGTAKPSDAEQQRVPHHLINLVDPTESFDTHRWCSAADAVVDELRTRERGALFAGGTPLYLMAYFKGMLEGPNAQPELRARLTAREAEIPGCLYEELGRVDPEAVGRIHRNDHKRIVRALEVYELTGTPISEQQDSFDAPGWLRPCRIVALTRPRDELHQRVRARTVAMLEGGLIDETRAIRDGGGFSAPAAAAIGYAECLRYLNGGFKDLEELRNRIRRSTHRLIRRQMTWLRRLREIRWLPADSDVETVLAAFESPPESGRQHATG